MENIKKQVWENFYLQKDPYGHDKYYSEKRRRVDSVALLKSRNLHFLNCLELGCGIGKITDLLLDLSDKIISVDIAQNAINIAKNRLNEKLDKLEFQQNDMYELDYPENKFDLIVGIEALDYTLEKEKQINKWIKWLKPNGYLLFSGPNKKKYFSFDELHNLFLVKGLEIIEIKIVTTKFPLQWFISRVKILQNNFFWNINMYFANSFPKTFAKHVAILVRKK